MPHSMRQEIIDIDHPKTHHLLFDEVRSQLYDDRLNALGLTSPKLLNYINLSQSSFEIPPGLISNHQTWMFTLSNKVIYQKRIVYDLFMMLGDVGGLMDFVYFVLAAPISIFADRLFFLSINSKFFRYQAKAYART